jgi:hypothetical protein
VIEITNPHGAKVDLHEQCARIIQSGRTFQTQSACYSCWQKWEGKDG